MDSLQGMPLKWGWTLTKMSSSSSVGATLLVLLESLSRLAVTILWKRLPPNPGSQMPAHLPFDLWLRCFSTQILIELSSLGTKYIFHKYRWPLAWQQKAKCFTIRKSWQVVGTTILYAGASTATTAFASALGYLYGSPTLEAVQRYHIT